MRFQNLLLAISILFLTACTSLFQQNKACETAPVPLSPTPAPSIPSNTIGQVEYVDILPQGIRQKARIDTGAATTSIDASDIQMFERDGKKWVKFSLVHRNTKKVTEFKKPLERTALIKRHGAETVKRPVIKLKLSIGSIHKTLEVNLADRSKFEFPVLIGRNFLDAGLSVDVSQKYLMLDK